MTVSKQLERPPPAALLKAARTVLRPLVRLMMQSRVTFPLLADALRSLFVEVAASDTLTDPKARTDSRISLLTGVHRKGSGTLTVAGQQVLVLAGTPGADRFGAEGWVSVSGLRRDDGTIVGSRLDRSASGTFIARGMVAPQGRASRVGNLMLPAAMAASVPVGQFAMVTGGYVDGRGQVDAVAADVMFADPAALFGHSVNWLVMQGFVRAANGYVWLNGVKLAAVPGVSLPQRPGGIVIVTLDRQPAGSFAAFMLA